MAGIKRVIDDDADDEYEKQLKVEPQGSDRAFVTCELPPLCSSNPQRFASAMDFESHYVKFHSNRCVTCGKVFPSERFLDLHITENHDPFAALKRERGDKIVSTWCACMGSINHSNQVEVCLFPGTV